MRALETQYGLSRRCFWGRAFFYAFLCRLPTVGTALFRVANDLGQKFTTLTGQKIFEAVCVEEHSAAGRGDIQLTYAAKSSVPVVSTARDETTLRYAGGLFKAREACHAQLKVAQEGFLRMTGLRPFVAYCPLVHTMTDSAFTLQIEGFGVPVNTPFYYGSSFIGSVDAGVMGELSGWAARAQAAGITVSFENVTRDSLAAQLGHVVILYYAPTRIPFTGLHPLHFKTRLECQEESTAFFQAMDHAQDLGLFGYCTYQDSRDEYTLNLVYWPRTELDSLWYPNTYLSQRSCREAKASAEATVSQTLQWKAVDGALCGLVGSTYQMLILGTK